MKLSIITINYNNKLGLQETIDSVLSQTYTDFEYLVIDGDSNDGSKEVLESCPDSLNWSSELDTGIYNAMNKGIEKASGVYLLFLNSGDTLRSATILSDVIPFLKTNKDIYYGNLAMQQVGGEKIREYPETLSFFYFFSNGSLPHPSMFIKKALFEKVGLYNENYKIIADWDFYVKAICKLQATYKHIDIVVSNFIQDGISSVSTSQGTIQKEKKDSLKTNFKIFIEDYHAYKHLKETTNIYEQKLINAIKTKPTAAILYKKVLKILKVLFAIKITK